LRKQRFRTIHGFSFAGANVCVVGRGPNGLLETAKAIEKLGQKSIYFAADVTRKK